MASPTKAQERKDDSCDIRGSSRVWKIPPIHRPNQVVFRISESDILL